MGEMDIRLSAHGVYSTQYHVVWVTKYRRKVLRPGVAEYFTKVLANKLRTMPGVETVETNPQLDHVHFVMIIPPKYSVATVMAKLKSQTASALRWKFKWLEQVYWEERCVWSPGYFVSTVGLNEKQILKYVKYQAHQDAGQARLAL